MEIKKYKNKDLLLIVMFADEVSPTPRNITLSCTIEGNPSPKVEWIWLGNSIKNNSLSGTGSAIFKIWCVIF